MSVISKGQWQRDEGGAMWGEEAGRGVRDETVETGSVLSPSSGGGGGGASSSNTP